MRAVNVEMSRKSKYFWLFVSCCFFFLQKAHFSEQILKTGSKPTFYGKGLNL